MAKKNEIDQLIYIFSKLPGLGPRSARRLVLHLLKDKENRMQSLIHSLSDAYNKITECEVCRNLDVVSPCKICCNSERNKEIIAIVETVADLWAIERSNMFKGIYHVLGGALSAGQGNTPTELGLQQLKTRIEQGNIQEVIIATNSTLEGQTTAFFITDFLKDLNIKISRLGSGIPMGGELDYLDEGTLTAAFASRHLFEV
ncbi:MAG: recR [Rickettsiaceae bacterium]|jgi:recombination protein RecR|nr:recR [Rickettsiaceae bacterium]